MKSSVITVVAAGTLALAASGGGSGSFKTNNGKKRTPISSPTPTPSPPPSPSPSPTPAPAPTQSPLDDGKIVVGIEGDSLSVDYGGYYAGYFKYMHPNIEVRIQAVGGSGLNNLVDRRDALIAFNPDVVTVFVGANDLGSSPSARDYVDRVLAYVAPIRARGTKVLVATQLGIYLPTNMAYTNNHNLLRDQVAELLRQQVGIGIDGVIDFARDPVVGPINAPTSLQLFSDGVHPTERGYNGSKGGHDFLYEVYRLAVEPVLPRQ